MTPREPLPDATVPGTVGLTVANLDRMVGFYTERLGFRVRSRDGDVARLGTASRDILILVERSDAKRAPRATGLYHFAVLLPSRPALARSLARLAELRQPLQGASDHLVSEALYLADPEGNGIELYRDRPREEWVRERGDLVMTTLPLDLQALLQEDAGTEDAWSGLPDGTVLGHVHLHVAHIAPAERFYRDHLGMTLTTRYGEMASFFAAGDYHHHVAVNTWQGVGAPRPPEGARGLREFTLVLPGTEALAAAAARLRAAGLTLETTPESVLVRDPSGNAVRLEQPPGSA